MADKLELSLDPNGEHIKLRWSKDDEPPSKPLRIDIDLLRKRSRELREALGALNSYVHTNQTLEEENDPGWRRYAGVLRALRQKGQALRSTLVKGDDEPSKELARAIEDLRPGAGLRVYCSDDEVTLPLGFVFEGEVGWPIGKPSRTDFAGFWLDRFKITMLVEGGGAGPERRNVDPQSLKTLYALHRVEVENALPYLGSDVVKLKQLTLLPIKQYYTWDAATRAYSTIREADNIIFVFAHSDGDSLELADSSIIDCNTFSLMLHRDRDPKRPVLLILNCCLSVAGGDGGSLLSAAARKGFCGLVGTEAEILNTYALRCGTRLMWELCFNGRPLGEALDEMQSAEDLFPLNLLYTCYAQRDFQLLRPIDPIDQIDAPHEQLKAA
jgi:hypothetical protein